MFKYNNILFVCAGNVARSIMAEAVLKNMNNGYSVQSAGLNPNIGTRPHNNTRSVLEIHGIMGNVMDKVSQEMTQELYDWADIILAMEEKQALQIESKLNGIGKSTTFKDDIADPTDAGSLETFEKTFFEIKDEVFRLFRNRE